MKVRIDPDLCTGCGLCSDSVPDVFKMGDDIAEVISADVPANLEGAVKEAAEDCPADPRGTQNQGDGHDRPVETSCQIKDPSVERLDLLAVIVKIALRKEVDPPSLFQRRLHRLEYRPDAVIIRNRKRTEVTNVVPQIRNLEGLLKSAEKSALGHNGVGDDSRIEIERVVGDEKTSPVSYFPEISPADHLQSEHESIDGHDQEHGHPEHNAGKQAIEG